MRRLAAILLPLLLCVLLAGCERRPLVDVGNTHYVRVYLDEELKNVTTGFYNENHARPEYESPDVLRVTLSDPTTDRVVAERYLRDLGRDERGNYYEGYVSVKPGRYNLLAYNFGTTSSILRGEHTYSDAEAYTNEIASHLLNNLPSRGDRSDERIVYDPDHLIVARCEGVEVPLRTYIDTLRTASGDYFMGQSIVKSYYLQIRVKGIQWVSSAVSLLTGVSGSARLHDGGVNEDDPVTLYIEMRRSDEPSRMDDTAVIYATFGMFGRLPDTDNKLEVSFDFLTRDGRALSHEFDITSKFDEPDAVEHQWLLLDDEIEIPEPPEEPGSGGGFEPGVDDWEDVNSDIII